MSLEISGKDSCMETLLEIKRPQMCGCALGHSILFRYLFIFPMPSPTLLLNL